MEVPIIPNPIQAIGVFVAVITLECSGRKPSTHGKNSRGVRRDGQDTRLKNCHNEPPQYCEPNQETSVSRQLLKSQNQDIHPSRKTS